MNRQSYPVFWTETAQQDLLKILDYIATDNPKQASIVYHKIKQQAENLGHMPSQGRIVPELRYFGIQAYRELIISPWRVIYKVNENKVLVLAVIDGRRNVEDVLLNRFIP